MRPGQGTKVELTGRISKQSRATQVLTKRQISVKNVYCRVMLTYTQKTEASCKASPQETDSTGPDTDPQAALL